MVAAPTVVLRKDNAIERSAALLSRGEVLIPAQRVRSMRTR
jgi:hypothetical protein